MTASAKRGFELFTGKANCAVCHMGYNFTDNGFHNIGIKDASAERGRGPLRAAKVKSMQGAFKTPTLRDIALTAPYMRNGMYKSLIEVVEHYDRGGDVKDNLAINMVPLSLTPAESADVVAFMESLDGVPRTGQRARSSPLRVSKRRTMHHVSHVSTFRTALVARACDVGARACG